MAETPDSGGEPTDLVECAACGEIYPAQVEEGGEFRPVGIEDECKCGNEEFTLIGT